MSENNNVMNDDKPVIYDDETNVNEKEIFPEIDDYLPGYENTRAQTALSIRPPDYNTRPEVRSSIIHRDKFLEVPVLTEFEARNVLAKYFDSKSYFGRKSIDDIKINDLQASNSYRYILKTFYESRTTQWIYEPCSDEGIKNDGPPPTRPWDIVIEPKEIFHKEIIKTIIPNTACVKKCNVCSGGGFCRCSSCKGKGKKRCKTCNGAGGRTTNYRSKHYHECIFCDGKGAVNCSKCNAYGKMSCWCCNGSGKLKWHIQMTVTFDTQIDDYIKRSEDIPLEKLRLCKAIKIFSEENSRVYALDHHHDQEINQSCTALMKTHLNLFQDSKILMQSHSLEAIPVTLCKYNYEKKEHEYKIFGLDNEIYIIESESKLCVIS